MSLDGNGAPDSLAILARLIFGEQRAYLPIGALDHQMHASSDKEARQRAMRIRWYPYPEDLDQAYADAATSNAGGLSIYWTPVLYPRAISKHKSNVSDLVWVVHLDGDTCDPRSFLVEPSILIQSSPGKYQALWLLSEPIPPIVVEDINRRIAYYHKDAGADTCHDVGHFLRIPGFINHKPDYDQPIVEVVYANDVRYEASDFAVYPTIATHTGENGSAELPNFQDLPDPLPSWLTGIIAENRTHDRSSEAWRIVRRGMELGYPYGMLRTAIRISGLFEDKYDGRIEVEEKGLFTRARFGTNGAKPAPPHDHPDQDCWDANCPNKHGDVEDPWCFKFTGLNIKSEQTEKPYWVLYEPDEHATPVPPVEWLVKNVWAANTHGPLGGAKKTFKSYHALAIAVAVGSGKPYLDEYQVRQGNVFYLIGEGGYNLWRRRYQRMCRAYGIGPKDGNVYATDTIVSVDSKDFAAMIGEVKRRIDPVLIIVDPMYAFHPRGIEAQNLYDRGRMLAELSALVDQDRSLIIPDHYRKSGEAKLDLDEIGQSGMSQWAHTWILQAHRKPYSFETGTAFLELEYGSREGYGFRRSLDLSVGTFDEETGEHEGEITWELNPYEEKKQTGDGAEIHTEQSLHLRLRALFDNPERDYEFDENREFTKPVGLSMLRDIFKFGKTQAYSKWNDLIGKTIVEGSKPGRFRIREDGPP